MWEITSSNRNTNFVRMLGENAFPIDYGEINSRAFNELATRIKTSASNSVNYLFF